jgi:SET domain-containing protein
MNGEYLLVKNSELHGNGLFVKKSFKEGEIITHIIGEMINADECIRRENEEENVYIFYKNDNEYIDVANNHLLKYLNHACDYNCDIDEDENGNLILYAVDYLKAGTELTIDYGYDEIYQYCSCSDCRNKLESEKLNQVSI